MYLYVYVCVRVRALCVCVCVCVWTCVCVCVTPHPTPGQMTGCCLDLHRPGKFIRARRRAGRRSHLSDEKSDFPQTKRHTRLIRESGRFVLARPRQAFSEEINSVPMATVYIIGSLVDAGCARC